MDLQRALRRRRPTSLPRSNPPPTASFTINNCTNDYTYIANGKFALYRKVGGDWIEYKGASVGYKKIAFDGNALIPAYGYNEITFSNLGYGQYYVVQTQSDDSYKTDSQKYGFSVVREYGKDGYLVPGDNFADNFHMKVDGRSAVLYNKTIDLLIDKLYVFTNSPFTPQLYQS